MTKKQYQNEFIQCVYGSKHAYKKAIFDDYCKVQEQFAFFVDGLTRDGIITDNQRFNASLPNYGKR